MTMTSPPAHAPGGRPTWTLRLHPGELVFAQLPPGSDTPEWARGGRPLTSVAWNEDETSVLAPADAVPAGIDHVGPWRAFEVEGYIDFLLTGVMHGIISPLAASHIAVTTVSTYRTDWILVPSEQAQAAYNVWRAHGYRVSGLDTATDGSPS